MCLSPVLACLLLPSLLWLGFPVGMRFSIRGAEPILTETKMAHGHTPQDTYLGIGLRKHTSFLSVKKSKLSCCAAHCRLDILKVWRWKWKTSAIRETWWDGIDLKHEMLSLRRIFTRATQNKVSFISNLVSGKAERVHAVLRWVVLMLWYLRACFYQSFNSLNKTCVTSFFSSLNWLAYCFWGYVIYMALLGPTHGIQLGKRCINKLHRPSQWSFSGGNCGKNILRTDATL